MFLCIGIARLNPLLISATALAFAAGCGSKPTAPSQVKVPLQSTDDERKLSPIQEVSPPSMPSDSDTITISSTEFRKGFDRTKFAIGESTTKYSLDGILLEVADKHALLVATDGRRLAVYNVGESPADNRMAVFLPKDSFSGISHLLEKENGDLHISINQQEFELKGTQGRIVLPISPPRFPDWKKVIPDKAGYQSGMLSVDSTLLTLVRSFQSQEEGARTRWSLSSGRLKLTPSPASTGITGDVAVNFSGKPVSIDLDPRYTIPFFRLLDSADKVEIRVIDSNCAAVFLVGPRYLYLVMPLSPE